jgi:hypothetical protein
LRLVLLLQLLLGLLWPLLGNLLLVSQSFDFTLSATAVEIVATIPFVSASVARFLSVL